MSLLFNHQLDQNGRDYMRAEWLEAHDEYEGVGAHELNPRYDAVDEGDHDSEIAEHDLPAFTAARSFLAAATLPIRLDGIDVSHYQYDAGSLNWDHVVRIPTWWGATKLTQSISYLDPTAELSRWGMKQSGITHRGLYHWLSSTTDPQRQAAYFLSRMGELQEGEFVMLDDEEGGVTLAKTVAWVDAVEAFTKRPVAIYTGAYVAGGTIWQNTNLREGKYGPRPMILAAYTTEAKALALPGVRTYPWSSWQFSSNGPVFGVAGRCDMNRVDDKNVYNIACGINVKPKPVPVPIIPGPTPIPQEDNTVIRILKSMQVPKEFNAEFVAVCDGEGHSIEVQWSGDGNDPAVAQRWLQLKGAGIQEQHITLAGLKNNRLHPKHTAEQIMDSLHIWSSADFA